MIGLGMQSVGTSLLYTTVEFLKHLSTSSDILTTSESGNVPFQSLLLLLYFDIQENQQRFQVHQKPFTCLHQRYHQSY